MSIFAEKLIIYLHLIFDRIPLHFLAIPPFRRLFPVGFPYPLQIPHFTYCRGIPLRVAALLKGQYILIFRDACTYARQGGKAFSEDHIYSYVCSSKGVYFRLQTRGGARNFPTGWADSSDEGAKIWFLGYYKCPKSPKKSFFTFQRGASMLRRGL